MSPKNKGKFGKAKPTEIPETDEFISGIDRVLRALKPHALRLAVVFGVIAIVVVSFTVWRWWGQRQEADATAFYARAVSLSEVQIADESPESSDKMPPDPRGLPTHFVNRAERAKAVVAAVEELQREHGDTDVARQADILAAHALLELGRFSDAANRYRAVVQHGGPEEIVLAAREGIGYALEDQAEAEKDPKVRQAGLEKALEAFEQVPPGDKGAGGDEALFHQARVLASLGRTDEAVKRFERVLTDHPDTGLKDDIELRLLALREQAPK